MSIERERESCEIRSASGVAYEAFSRYTSNISANLIRKSVF